MVAIHRPLFMVFFPFTKCLGYDIMSRSSERQIMKEFAVYFVYRVEINLKHDIIQKHMQPLVV